MCVCVCVYFFAGLPDEGNLNEFERVWTAMKRRGDSLKSVSLLMSLVHSVEESYLLAHNWKLSNNDKRLGVFVVENRALGYKSDLKIKTFQDFLVDGIPCSSVVEVLYYCDRPDIASQLQQWKVPIFPVSGKDLQSAGFKPGRDMGKMIKQLRDKWKESYFTLTRQDLLEVAIRENPQKH